MQNGVGMMTLRTIGRTPKGAVLTPFGRGIALGFVVGICSICYLFMR